MNNLERELDRSVERYKVLLAREENNYLQCKLKLDVQVSMTNALRIEVFNLKKKLAKITEIVGAAE